MSSEHMFQAISAIAIIGGIICLTRKRFSRILVLLGSIALIIIFVVLAISLCLSCSIFWRITEGGASNLNVDLIHIYALTLITYYIVNGERIAKNYQDLMEMEEIIYSSSILDENNIKEIIKNNRKRINFLIKFHFWCSFFVVPLNSFFKILSRMKIYDSETENTVLYAVYYDSKSRFVFWPTLLIQGVALHAVIVIHTINDLYLLNVTALLVLSFKYLRIKLAYILNTFDFDNSLDSCDLKNSDNLNLLLNPMLIVNHQIFQEPQREQAQGKNYERIKTWIQLHANILRLCREFCHLYSPVLIAYFGNMLLSISLGILIVTQDQTNFFSPAEKILIGSYSVGNGVILMHLCTAGTDLINESSQVFSDAFHAPWYRMSRSVRSTLSVVSTAARRPVRLTPLDSLTLHLSLDTFIWMTRVMVSFYIALAEIKAQLRPN